MLLTPLPRAAGRQRSRTPKRQKTKKGKGKGDSDKGKGAGDNSGKKQKSDAYKVAVPREPLPEGVGMTDSNESICFGFNCKRGCFDAKPGEACKRGWHVCAKKGCYEAHTFCNRPGEAGGA